MQQQSLVHFVTSIELLGASVLDLQGGIMSDRKKGKSRSIIAVFVFMVSVCVGLIGIVIRLVFKDAVWSQVMLGISGGLGAWVLTYLVVHWIDESTEAHYATTSNIWEKVRSWTDRHISKRGEIPQYFYSECYLWADQIRISGYANKGFFRYLTSDEWTAKEGAEHLLAKMRSKGVSVKVVVMDPFSKTIEIEDTRDCPANRKRHAQTIRGTLALVKRLYEEGQHKAFHTNSEIDIRVSEIPINPGLFAAHSLDSKRYRVLMNILWLHKTGEDSPGYVFTQGDNDESVPGDCVSHFDKLFELVKEHQLAVLRRENAFFNEKLFGQLCSS